MLPSAFRNAGVRKLPLIDFYENFYRPARHPGDPNSPTCVAYRINLNWLDKKAQFENWIPSQKHLKGKSLQEQLNAFHVHNQQKCWFEGGKLPYRTRVRDLSDELVSQAMAFAVQAGRERSTANKIRLHCNAVWNFAYEAGFVKSAPKNKRYKELRKEPVAWLPEEIAALLDGARTYPGFVGDLRARIWWPATISFIFCLGVRVSAAWEVKTKNLDLDEGYVLIEAETQKHRSDQRLDLFPSSVAMLKKLKLKERGVDRVLGDYPHSLRRLRLDFKKVLVHSGLFPDLASIPRNMNFHALRKSLASQIYQAGGISVACNRLGHSTELVTKRYIDPRFRNDPKVRDLIPDPFGCKKPTCRTGKRAG